MHVTSPAAEPASNLFKDKTVSYGPGGLDKRATFVKMEQFRRKRGSESIAFDAK